MKKIIDAMLAEDYSFGHKKSQLSFSCTSLEYGVAFGRTVRGSFTIIADEKLKPEGYVYASDLRMLVSRNQFGGLEMEIPFQFDAHGLEEGSVCEGVFAIVSNLGEYELPYRITVERNLPDTSMGVIRNLFHYANLAKENWQEAVKLFYSPGFIHILDGSERQYRSIYRGMSVCEGNEQNVENFLTVVKKKISPVYQTDTMEIEINAPKETVMQTVSIVRDGWGYTKLHLCAEGGFLSLEKEQVLEEDFLGNVFRMNYYIHADRLHYGKNEGALVIKDIYENIRIPVVVWRSGMERLEEEKIERRQLAHLMRLYMDYRTGRITKFEWGKECHAIVNRIVSKDANHLVSRLYQLQLLLTEKRYTEADRILERVGILIDGQDVPPEVRGYYYYMKSLRSKDEDLLRELAEKTEYLYVRNTHNWRLAWLLIYMKEEYASNDQKKWDLLKQQYAYGNASPILFLEALHALLRMPALMSELGDFELAFITFAIRQNTLTREIRNRFVFLAGKAKTFSEELYYLLCCCYELENKNETLQAICALLIKGNKMGREYFGWYARAVDQELRLTRLYEYYIMSIDLTYEDRLPKMIVMYFAYRSNLDYERNAFLYANIMKYRQAYHDIYQDYYPAIMEFVREQLLRGRINENLAYLYQQARHMIHEDPILITAYLKLLFMAQVDVEMDGVKYVVVVNEHLKEETRYPVFQKKAVVPMIGTESALLLEDGYGNRFVDSRFFHYRLLLPKPADLEEMMEQAEISLDLALYRAQESGDSVLADAQNEKFLFWLSAQEELTEEYRIRIMVKLAEYYFENDLLIPLDDLLFRFDPYALSPEQREICIHIMVARGLYDKALEWVRNCGIESAGDKTLLRLCDRILMRTDFEYEPELLKICDGIFCRGIYDETTLQYLLLYKEGLLAELKALWRAADSFDMDVHKFLENMLVQMLYSDTYVDEAETIFLEYIAQATVTDIEKVFLAKLSYDYFVGDKPLSKKLIDRTGYLQQLGETPPVVCRLAYLKKNMDKAEQGILSGQDQEYAVAFIGQLWKKQIFFPMFLCYRRWISKLDLMDDRCYIEYRGKEDSRVVIHYAIEREDRQEKEYRKEEMIHMYGGIYVKSFVIFYGERIRYYITEEDGRQEKLTQSSSLQREAMTGASQDNRFQLVNHMIISHDMQDDKTYGKLAEEYAFKDYQVRHLFTPDFNY